MNDKSNIQPRAKIMWYFEPRIERKKSRYRSTFLVRLLGSKYFIILALVGYLLFILHLKSVYLFLHSFSNYLKKV